MTVLHKCDGDPEGCMCMYDPTCTGESYRAQPAEERMHDETPAAWEVAAAKAIESQDREDAAEAFRLIREAHGRGASTTPVEDSGGETHG